MSHGENVPNWPGEASEGSAERIGCTLPKCPEELGPSAGELCWDRCTDISMTGDDIRGRL